MRSSVGLPDELLKRLARIPSLSAIVLFGSYARGEADRRSDIDILLVFDTREDIKHSRDELLDALKEYHELPLALTKKSMKDIAVDPRFFFNVFKEGYVLYKRPDAKLIPAAIAGEKHAIIYRYDLSSMPHERKLKFNASLFTRVKGKYRYPGLLERIGGEKLGYGAVMIPANAEREMDELLKTYNMKPRKFHAIIL
jgi:predicted nucleotidyltransferase